jgi:hypothetical protein
LGDCFCQNICSASSYCGLCSTLGDEEILNLELNISLIIICILDVIDHNTKIYNKYLCHVSINIHLDSLLSILVSKKLVLSKRRN